MSTPAAGLANPRPATYVTISKEKGVELHEVL